MQAILNWSGGKDSALALHALQKNGGPQVGTLLTTINREYDRVTQHGVRAGLLQQQADAIGISLYRLYMPDKPSMEAYNAMMTGALQYFKSKGVQDAIYGDIFLERVRHHREERLSQMDFNAHFPLWQEDTEELARRFVDDGFKAIVVCVDERYLDQSFVGRVLDHSFLDELPEGVDPCGEHGEYHSFVYDGPVFQRPVSLQIGQVVYRNYEPPRRDERPAGAHVCIDGSGDPGDTSEDRASGKSAGSGDASGSGNGTATGYTTASQGSEPAAHAPTGFWYCELLEA